MPVEECWDTYLSRLRRQWVEPQGEGGPPARREEGGHTNRRRGNNRDHTWGSSVVKLKGESRNRKTPDSCDAGNRTRAKPRQPAYDTSVLTTTRKGLNSLE
ncbi:hypothetical protein Bbelb_180370 [Branchiostoma belcheri]|nr:hypothetical protein Bbelb_180370 [Branchiostoma belcheri]